MNRKQNLLLNFKIILIKNYLVSLLLFIIPFTTFSQSNSESDLAKSGVSECKIIAMEYENGQRVKKNTNSYRYDRYGREIHFISADSTCKKTEEVNWVYYKNGKYWEETRTDFYAPGKKYVYVDHWSKDTLLRTLTHVELSGNGDTLVDQKWYRDVYGNDSILFSIKKGIYTINFASKYDKAGKFLNRNNEKKIYTRNDSIQCWNSYNSTDTTKIIYRTCKSKLETTTFYYHDSEGYVFGIKLKRRNGGECIEKRKQNGLIQEIIYSDQTGQLLDKINYAYTAN